MLHIDLARLDLDPLDDELDGLTEGELRAELLDDLAGSLGIDPGRLEELESFIGISGLVIVRQDENPGKATGVRKCLDCPEPARPRKSANGPYPKRCEACTGKRKKFMDSGGSKARPQYRACCISWQLDDNPDHRGLCLQCRTARKESRRPVSHREAGFLASTLGPAGWHVEKGGQWLRDGNGWERIETDRSIPYIEG